MISVSSLCLCAIEQAILSHPDIAEASVVGIPDPVKGHLPFAFVQLRKTSASSNSNSNSPIPATPPPALFTSVNNLVRGQIGAIASLGGMIQSGGEGKGMIPKTRSGKTLRRVLRELVENAVEKGDFERAVNVPATVEDVEVIEVARGRVREYFVEREKREMEKKERVGWAKL